MAHYGPPGGPGGGPYPGQPEDPWGQGGGQQGQPGQPYGQPPQQDPYGQPPGNDPFGNRMNDPLGGGGQMPPTAPFQGQGGPGQGDPFGGPMGPGPGDPGGPGGPGGGMPWEPPPLTEQKKSKGPLIAVIIVVVLVLIGGAGAGWYFLLGPGKGKSTSNQAKGKTSASASASASATGDEGPAGTVQTGACVVPSKTDKQSVSPSDCGSQGALKVVKRLDGTTDKSKCPDNTNYVYTYTSKLSSSKSFVLCLASQGSGNQPTGGASASPSATGK